MKLLLTLILALLQTIATAAAQSRFPDVAEPGSIEAIAAATTEARFLSPWCRTCRSRLRCPRRARFLGRIPGAPGELADTAKAQAYFRALAAASPRVSSSPSAGARRAATS